MAHFIGYFGARNRPSISRTAGRNGGLIARLASFSGSLHAEIYNRDGEDRVRVEFDSHLGVGTEALLYDGPVNPGDQNPMAVLDAIVREQIFGDGTDACQQRVIDLCLEAEKRFNIKREG